VQSATGQSYEGEWQDDKWHGRGMYRYLGGCSYDGEFKCGEMHGRGTYLWPSGQAYRYEKAKAERDKAKEECEGAEDAAISSRDMLRM